MSNPMVFPSDWNSLSRLDWALRAAGGTARRTERFSTFQSHMDRLKLPLYVGLQFNRPHQFGFSSGLTRNKSLVHR